MDAVSKDRMSLKNVLSGVNFKAEADIDNVSISGITDDSRTAKPGDAFIAIKGYDRDGSVFVGDAIKNGAAIVIAGEDVPVPDGVLRIIVDNIKALVPTIADNFYRSPWKDLKVIGITGTNGKTTITYIIESILKASGKTPGVIGTINYRIGDNAITAKNTTPGPVELQKLFFEMKTKGADSIVMEVSSHSLDQDRIGKIRFDAAIFTNITSDHMDYHKNRENYFKAKARLFEMMKNNGTALLNIDDDMVASLKNKIKGDVLTYGIKKKADIQAKDIRLSLGGSAFTAVTPEGAMKINTNLIGMHNISNILAGIAAGVSFSIKPEYVIKGVERASLVPGRLESVEAGQAFKIFVDYAHTEDALYNILTLLREVSKGKIVTVFGCGGDRDRQKRPLMGKVACKFSDHVIITSDNPRFEEPGDIIDDITRGIRDEFSNYETIIDRYSAIEKAVRMSLSDEDVVVIAGKGHEGYQIVKDRAIFFDDRKAVKDVLNKLPCSKKQETGQR